MAVPLLHKLRSIGGAILTPTKSVMVVQRPARSSVLFDSASGERRRDCPVREECRGETV